MCPPKQCCCCGIAMGLKVTCVVLIITVFLGLINDFLSLASANDFCSTTETAQHLANAEAGTLDADCDGDECNVRESGKWIDVPGEISVDPEAWHGARAADSGPFPMCETDPTIDGGISTYTLVREQAKTWNVASAHCRLISDTTHLVNIGSAAENEEIRLACGENVCWIGLHKVQGRIQSDGWQWNDEPSTLAYENWQCWTSEDCEPNDKGNENAAVMNYWVKNFTNHAGNYELCYTRRSF